MQRVLEATRDTDMEGTDMEALEKAHTDLLKFKELRKKELAADWNSLVAIHCEKYLRIQKHIEDIARKAGVQK